MSKAARRQPIKPYRVFLNITVLLCMVAAHMISTEEGKVIHY